MKKILLQYGKNKVTEISHVDHIDKTGKKVYQIDSVYYEVHTFIGIRQFPVYSIFLDIVSPEDVNLPAPCVYDDVNKITYFFDSKIDLLNGSKVKPVFQK
jgi:hypothetical protein